VGGGFPPVEMLKMNIFKRKKQTSRDMRRVTMRDMV